jgi:hypothetical protein
VIVGQTLWLSSQPQWPLARGCQIFLGTTCYQKPLKLAKRHKIYQIAAKYSKRPSNIPILKIPSPYKIYPNWDYHLVTPWANVGATLNCRLPCCQHQNVMPIKRTVILPKVPWSLLDMHFSHESCCIGNLQ